MSSNSSTKSEMPERIPVIISNRTSYRGATAETRNRKRNVKTVKRLNKQVEALFLPTVINLNPRSVYNKVDEFHTMVTELEGDIICMSESWERENLTLDKVINLDNYKIISNVHQQLLQMRISFMVKI